VPLHIEHTKYSLQKAIIDRRLKDLHTTDASFNIYAYATTQNIVELS